MRTYSRRDMSKKASLATSAAVGAALTRLPVLHAAKSARKKLGVAVIGCGGQGKRLPLWMARSRRLVAMLDIDDKAIPTALENIKDTDAKPKIYHDYRRMLDECHKDLNVALIAAPDHHHAPAAIRAMERLFSTLCGILSCLALSLCCIGLYGLMTYNVTRRTSEMGIRMAFGARPRDVAWPILREAMTLTAIGVAIGLPVALALVRVIRVVFYGIEPHDPLTMVGAAVVMIAVAALAAFIPARRAAKIDPMEALRYE